MNYSSKDILKLKKLTYANLVDCVYWYKKFNFDFNKTLLHLNKITSNRNIEEINREAGDKWRIIKSITKIQKLGQVKIAFFVYAKDDFLFSTKEFKSQFLLKNNSLVGVKEVVDWTKIDQNLIYWWKDCSKNLVFKQVNNSIVRIIKENIDIFTKKSAQSIILGEYYWSFELESKPNSTKLWIYRHFDYKSCLVIKAENLTPKIFDDIYKIVMIKDIEFYSWDSLEAEKKIKYLTQIKKTLPKLEIQATEKQKEKHYTLLQKKIMKYRQEKELLSHYYKEQPLREYFKENKIRVLDMYLIK